MKTDDSEQTLFVFYTLKTSSVWKYEKIPAGWRWIGAGKTTPVGTTRDQYWWEEQFSGPTKNKKTMINYLMKIFDKLKKKGILTKYKIRQSYLP